MRKEIKDFKNRMINGPKTPVPYGNNVIHMWESLAELLGIKPDYETLKQTQPELYEQLWHNGILPLHYFHAKLPDEFRESFRRMEHIYSQVYEIDDQKVDDLRYKDLVNYFNTLFKYQD
jgi:hypothetical protein